MRKFLSHKGRSIWKGYSFKGTLKNPLLNRVYLIKKKDLGKEVYIYNGLNFFKLYLLSKHLGYKLGQFSLTKKMGKVIHLKNVKKSLKKQDKKKKK